MKKLLIVTAMIFPLFFDHFAMAELSDSAHQCAVDLCGPARENIDWALTGARLPIEVEKEVQREIDPKIDALLKLEIKKNLAVFESVETLLKNFESGKITPLAKAMMNLGIIGAIMSSFNSDQMKEIYIQDQQGSIKINRESFLKGIPTFSSEQGNSIILALETYLADPAVRSLQSIDSRMPIDLFFKIQKQIDHQKDLRMLADSMLQKIKLADQEGLGLTVTQSGRNLVRRIKKQGVLPLAQQNSFISLYSQLNLLSAVNSPQMISALSAPQLTVAQIKSFTHIDAIAEHGRHLLNSKKKLTPLLRKMSDQLKHAVRSLIASGGTPQEMRAAEVMVEIVRKRAAQIIESHVANVRPEVLQTARNSIMKATIEWPLNQAEVLAQTKIRLSEDLADSYERMKQIQTNASGSPHSPIVLAMVLGSLSGDETDLLNVDDLIKSYTPPGPEDAAYSSLKQVRVGWQTIKNPRFGMGIWAHELGHIASYELGLGAVPVKTCTAERHLESNTLFDKSNPLYQAEEDWADAFSTAVITSLPRESLKPLNMGCLLLDWNKKTHDYDSLSMTNSFKGDIHSSGLYRLIQIQSGMGPLPDSCVQATNLPSSSDFFKSCIQH
ncbi:MAG: hypothetical protein ACXWRE_09050 [Pseudobdellovibrionaceae bacterium]